MLAVTLKTPDLALWKSWELKTPAEVKVCPALMYKQTFSDTLTGISIWELTSTFDFKLYSPHAK